jgi:hypothetical protein
MQRTNTANLAERKSRVTDRDGRVLGTVVEIGGFFRPDTARGLTLAPCKTYREAANALRALAGRPTPIVIDGRTAGAVIGTTKHAAAIDAAGKLIGVFPKPKAIKAVEAAFRGQLGLSL